MALPIKNVRHMGKRYDCKKCGTNYKPRTGPVYGKECKRVHSVQNWCAKIKKFIRFVRNVIDGDDNVNNEFQVNKMKKICQITGRCEYRNKVVKLINIRVRIKLDSASNINIL